MLSFLFAAQFCFCCWGNPTALFQASSSCQQPQLIPLGSFSDTARASILTSLRNTSTSQPEPPLQNSGAQPHRAPLLISKTLAPAEHQPLLQRFEFWLLVAFPPDFFPCSVLRVLEIVATSCNCYLRNILLLPCLFSSYLVSNFYIKFC